MHGPHLRIGGGVSVPTLHFENIYIIIWMSILPQLFFESLIYISMDSQIFILCLSYNPILLYFIAQIIPALVIGSSFGWLLGFFDISQMMQFCFVLGFKYFVIFWKYKMFQVCFVYFLFQC